MSDILIYIDIVNLFTQVVICQLKGPPAGIFLGC